MNGNTMQLLNSNIWLTKHSVSVSYGPHFRQFILKLSSVPMSSKKDHEKYNPDGTILIDSKIWLMSSVNSQIFISQVTKILLSNTVLPPHHFYLPNHH